MLHRTYYTHEKKIRKRITKCHFSAGFVNNLEEISIICIGLWISHQHRGNVTDIIALCLEINTNITTADLDPWNEFQKNIYILTLRWLLQRRSALQFTGNLTILPQYHTG